MRRYVLTLLGILALLLAGTLVVASFGINQCTLLDRNICGLYHYQDAKLAAVPQTLDILFVGDSALGNAIDAKQVAALSGRTTLSLALSGGALGLPAIATQLEDAARRSRIANVVIMVSPETYRRRFSSSVDGFVLANHAHLGRIVRLPPRLAVQSVDALVRFLFDDGVVADGWRFLTTGMRDLGDCDGCAERDYIAQEPNGRLSADDIRRWRGPVDDYDVFLKRIARLCETNGINCLYSHGPLVQSVLDLNPGYVAKINRKLEKAHLRTVAPDAIVIPPDEAGDSVNHVRADLRGAYTEKIYRSLAPLLK
jgi:hypothetical protein